MTKPFWRKVEIVKVDALPGTILWTLALDWVSGPRLLKFTRSDKDKAGATVRVTWNLTATDTCSGNGIASSSPTTGALCKGANLGAMIGKIGGSAADRADAPAAADTVPYPGRKVFPVGDLCIIQLASTDGGPLFLTMNDEPSAFSAHDGTLYVLIEEAAI